MAFKTMWKIRCYAKRMFISVYLMMFYASQRQLPPSYEKFFEIFVNLILSSQLQMALKHFKQKYFSLLHFHHHRENNKKSKNIKN